MVAMQQEPAVNVKALSWTIAVHVALLLLFLLWHYTLPVTVQAEEQGMEVNLGTSDNGSGTDQPMATEDPAAYEASVTYHNATAPKATGSNMLQSTDADAPVVNSNSTNAKNTNNTAVDKTPKKTINQTATDNSRKQE